MFHGVKPESFPGHFLFISFCVSVSGFTVVRVKAGTLYVEAQQ